jgi:uncharacterized protein YdbL (DUF1318 family)
MKTLASRFSLLFLGLLFFGSGLAAQDLGSVRQSMAQRLPELDRLKAEGVLGENNRGFVEVRAAKADAAQITAAENGDREVVYTAIAKQTGVSPDAVGRARARQIAGGSASGVWLQNEQGSWSRKP